MKFGEGVSFSLESLRRKDENGSWFVPAMNKLAIIYRYDILEREPDALKKSSEGGWRLIDELPDTDTRSGDIMSWATFAGRWKHNPSLVLKHLLKKHEGELVELQGGWVRGEEKFIPDALFDAQFASCEEEFRSCKGLDKGAGKKRSKYSADYHSWQRHIGKSRGKGKPAVGEPAVGGSGKGPADGGKGRSIMQRLHVGESFISNVLRVYPDGTWYVRQGVCMSLAHLFAKLGKRWTAAKLYQYYNLCNILACKRTHPWGSPANQAAASGRFATSGMYGHGRGGATRRWQGGSSADRSGG